MKQPESELLASIVKQRIGNMRDVLIVSGSRIIDDEDLVDAYIEECPWWPPTPGKIITGDAEGVDEIAGEKAQRLAKWFDDVEYEEYEAEWNEYGKSAGPIRNEEMAKEADYLIAIWDGQSSGTEDMIEKAKEYDLDIYIKIEQ